ncbi:MAG TPA: hypothetical protein VIX35_00245, partial [Vicinamibacterales bacterium]
MPAEGCENALILAARPSAAEISLGLLRRVLRRFSQRFIARDGSEADGGWQVSPNGQTPARVFEHRTP